MKKTVLTVLCAAMLLGMTAIPAYAADSETVYVSIADENGDLVLPYQPVTATDIDGDGALTINDALYAAHTTYYDGGSDGYGSAQSDWGLSLTKLWGVENGGSYGYYVNNASAMSLADPVSAGSYVAAFVYTDTAAFSDTYCYFDAQQITDGVVGDSITLTLSAAGFDENFAPISYPVAGAEITVNGAATGVYTDENGVASVPFYTAGTYTISAHSDSQTLVPPVCLAVIGENAPQTADYGVWCLGGAVVMLGAAYVTARKERSYEN